MDTAQKSKILALMLTVGTAVIMTVVQSIAAPVPAQAGVLGSIKGAAKSAGSAVKSTATKFGSVDADARKQT